MEIITGKDVETLRGKRGGKLDNDFVLMDPAKFLFHHAFLGHLVIFQMPDATHQSLIVLGQPFGQSRQAQYLSLLCAVAAHSARRNKYGGNQTKIQDQQEQDKRTLAPYPGNGPPQPCAKARKQKPVAQHHAENQFVPAEEGEKLPDQVDLGGYGDPAEAEQCRKCCKSSLHFVNLG